MYILINFLIFVITLFLYIHIYFHIKTSNYLEIYELENMSKEKYEEICNLKQPFLFNYDDVDFINNNLITMDFLKSNYSTFDVKIYNKENSIISLPMNLITASDLLTKDISSNYYSEHNIEFLEETTLIKKISEYDIFLRPLNISYKNYDIMFGSINSYTKLKYSLNFRTLFYVNSGSIEIILTNPNNKKYLHINDVNENFEYISNIDYYNVDEKYLKDFNKVKFLNITLKEGNIFCIPAYWFYCIKFNKKNSVITKYEYRTFMNSMAILPDYFKKVLHDNNIKRNLLKVVENN